MDKKHKKLTLKELQKRHIQHPQDKPLHDFLEKGGRKDAEKEFNAILEQSVKSSKT